MTQCEGFPGLGDTEVDGIDGGVGVEAIAGECDLTCWL